jgi:hypothetical protein
MIDEFCWFVGIDWASEQHRICLLDADGKVVAERDVSHDGTGLTQLCDWLIERTGAAPSQIAVAIETPRGPVVETLMERGFQVFAINPKQLDRFRDRFTVAGAKDDSRDAQVLGSSLRTDRNAFRRLAPDNPLVIELREWSRMHDDLKQEQVRLANRLGSQLWRYYPQACELSDDLAADWFLDLWQQIPTPAKAARANEKTIARILKSHRIRRIDAPTVLTILRQPPLVVAPGTIEAATAHIQAVAARLRLINAQIKEAQRRLDQLCAAIEAAAESTPGQICEQHDNPAFLSRARKDHHRHAARRGLRASAATRLQRFAAVVGSGPGHSPQRQELDRAAATRLQQPTAQCRLSLGTRRHPA